TGHIVGGTFISYTITSGCGSAVALSFVSITPSAPVGPITGPSSVCAGSTVALSHSVTGGTWTSSAPSIATVNSAGVVTGVAAGVTTISYAVSAGCGISVVWYNITVYSTVSAGGISGANTICVGATDLLTATLPGGTWS